MLVEEGPSTRRNGRGVFPLQTTFQNLQGTYFELEVDSVNPLSSAITAPSRLSDLLIVASVAALQVPTFACPAERAAAHSTPTWQVRAVVSGTKSSLLRGTFRSPLGSRSECSKFFSQALRGQRAYPVARLARTVTCARHTRLSKPRLLGFLGPLIGWSASSTDALPDFLLDCSNVVIDTALSGTHSMSVAHGFRSEAVLMRRRLYAMRSARSNSTA